MYVINYCLVDTPSAETQAVAGKLVSCTGTHPCIQASLRTLAKSDDTTLLGSCFLFQQLKPMDSQ